jgi:hypothetical protein
MKHEAALLDLVRRSPRLMQLLDAGRQTGLAEWAIGAGAIRNLVWDSLHGYAAPTPLADIDFVYFEPALDREREIAATLGACVPDAPWDVTNQAIVHRWYAQHYGQARAAIPSLVAGIAGWPEFATCVAVTLGADGEPAVIAPHGLDDLFAMRIRRNAQSLTSAQYAERIVQKRFTGRWPRVQVEMG